VPSGRNWVCHYQILGIGNEKTEQVLGADSMQALLLTIRYISVRLNHWQSSYNLTWDGKSDLGFLPPRASEKPGDQA